MLELSKVLYQSKTMPDSLHEVKNLSPGRSIFECGIGLESFAPSFFVFFRNGWREGHIFILVRRRADASH